MEKEHYYYYYYWHFHCKQIIKLRDRHVCLCVRMHLMSCYGCFSLFLSSSVRVYVVCWPSVSQCLGQSINTSQTPPTPVTAQTQTAPTEEEIISVNKTEVLFWEHLKILPEII